MDRRICPNCGDQLLSSSGPLSANVLVVGDYPDWLDVITGTPFYDKDKKLRAGNILRSELTRVNINPGRVRYTNLWLHAKKKKGQCEQGFHNTILIRELLKVEYVLLSGSEPLKLFLGDNATAAAWSGLSLKSPDLPSEVKAMGCVKIATGFDMIGEVRLAIQRFGELVHGN